MINKQIKETTGETEETINQANLNKLNEYIASLKTLHLKHEDNSDFNCFYVPTRISKLFTDFGYYPKTVQEANTIFRSLYLTDVETPFTAYYFTTQNKSRKRNEVIISEQNALCAWYTPIWKNLNFEQKLKIVLWTLKIIGKQFNLPKIKINFINDSYYLKNTSGSYSPNSNYIFINPIFLLMPDFQYKNLMTIVHELYHAKHYKIINEIPVQKKLNQIESYYLGCQPHLLQQIENMLYIHKSKVFEAYKTISTDEMGAIKKGIKIATQVFLSNTSIFGKNNTDYKNFLKAKKSKNEFILENIKLTGGLSKNLDKALLYVFATNNKSCIKKTKAFYHNFNNGDLQFESFPENFFTNLPIKDNFPEKQ